MPANASIYYLNTGGMNDDLGLTGDLDIQNGVACEGSDGADFVNPPLDHVPVPRP